MLHLRSIIMIAIKCCSDIQIDQQREWSSTYVSSSTVIGLMGPKSSEVALCLIRQEAGLG